MDEDNKQPAPDTEVAPTQDASQPVEDTNTEVELGVVTDVAEATPDVAAQIPEEATATTPENPPDTATATTIPTTSPAQAAAEVKSKKKKSHRVLLIIAIIMAALAVIGGVATAVILIMKEQSREFLTFDGVEDYSSSVRDDGVRLYSGKLNLVCHIDEDSLSTDSIALPDDKVETVSCRTDAITGTARYNRDSSIDIDYPAIDQKMANHEGIWYETYSEYFPDKVEAYTREWQVSDKGEISFYRAVENMSETGMPKASFRVPDGSEEYTYDYKFTLNEKDKVRAIYDLTISISLDEAEKSKLTFFQSQADQQRSAVYSQMMSNAIAPDYDDLLQSLVNGYTGRYDGKPLKFSGYVLVTQDNILDDDACQVGLSISGSNLNDIWVTSCTISGVSLSRGDKISIVGLADGLETFTAINGRVRAIPKIKAYRVTLDNSQSL